MHNNTNKWKSKEKYVIFIGYTSGQNLYNPWNSAKDCVLLHSLCVEPQIMLH